MRYSLHPEAKKDLREAAKYYRAQAEAALSQALFTEFERSVLLLLQHPLLGPAWRHGKRRLIMKHFPYSIVYTVVGAEIRVLAVAHQSRHPGYWQKRK